MVKTPSDNIWNPLSILLISIIELDGVAPLIVILEVTSKSPVAEASSLIPATERVMVPAGNVIVCAPPSALLSCIAALSGQLPNPSSQIPLPGFESTASTILFTTKF